MLDPLLADLFDYVQEQHAATEYARNPDILCRAMGITLLTGSRSLARAGQRPDGDVILLRAEEFASRNLFTTAHEIAHILARRGGYIRAIRHYHSSVPNMPRHIERVVNHAAGLILIPAPDLYAAAREYGDRPGAIVQLSLLTGASEAAAMRRWAWQDTSEYRAAFTLQGNYVQDLAACRARLPFRRWARIPEITLSHPDVQLLCLGGDRVIGTVA